MALDLTSGFKLFGGKLAGTTDGSNRVFTLTDKGTPLTVLPAQLQLIWNAALLIPDVGFSIALVDGEARVTLLGSITPSSDDDLYAQGILN